MRQIFPGDGEMATLCREFDWASTPLGAPERWSASLRTTVSTLIMSRHPMLLFWGADHIQLYNDAYRPILGSGDRHPRALGARGREFWEEIWGTIGPRIEQVLAGGDATWHEDQPLSIYRNGRLEEVFWTYSYTPVREDDGGIQGVLVVCQETTARVRAEAEVKALARRLTTTLESITDAFFTLDPEWRFTFVNREVERLLDLDREKLLGRVIWEVSPGSVPATFEERYREAVATGAAVRFEEFHPPLDRWFAVHAYPSAEGLAVSFQDITDRREAEQRLAERDRMLTMVGRTARVGGWLVDLDSGTVHWSDEVCAIHGMPPGTTLRVEEGISFFAPEWRPLITELFTRCATDGVPYDQQLQIITTQGARIWVRAIGEAIRDEEGTIRKVQGAFQDIQSQKEAEEALQESSRRFRQVVESMPLVVWSADPSGAIDYQTRLIRDFAGVVEEELHGDNWLDIVHPADRDRTVEAWTHSVKTGDPYEVDFRVRRFDGAWRWHFTRALPFRGKDGEILKWYGSTIDIHDQLELRMEAQALARRLATTLESVTDAFYLLDPDWRFAFMNAEAERVLGCIRDDVLGRTIWEAFPSTPGTELEREYLRAVDRDEPGEFRFFDEGRERWFHIRAFPSSEGLAVYFRDITAERGTELRLREQAELLDKAQDAILVRDLDHTLVFWNAGAERMYGWARDEVLGRSARDLLHADPEPFDAATSALRKKGEWSGEMEHQCRDGTLISVEARWSLVRDHDGEPSRILAINTDVTERKKLLAQFLRAQRMESIGTLAGGIAHDLNNVLAPILLSIGYLREEIRDPALTEILTSIQGSAERGAEMVKQVLGYARGMDRSDLAVDLGRTLDDLGRVVRDAFPKNITFSCQVSPDIWPLRGDPTQVHQVFMNLFVNARDAMPDGGDLTVSVGNVEMDEHYASMAGEIPPGRYVRIAVTDTGSGIPRENVARIFDPFFTTKEVGKGTGLGLSTVAAIVKSHGGFIDVYSEVDSGTTFQVYLPAGPGAEEDRVAAPAHEGVKGHGELILVVDDEQPIRQVVKRTLEGAGYRVVTATDGADALATYGRLGDEIALVLTDMIMPVMDGPATIRALRRMNPGVRIIGASGLGATDGGLRNPESDVEHFLPKPYTARSLLDLVHRVIRE